MNAKVLDGRAVANGLENELTVKINALKKSGSRLPGLAVVLVGENVASEIYVNNKIKACERIGIQSFVHRLGIETTEVDLLILIDQLNQNNRVDGILVQLPLPSQIRTNTIIDAIVPTKDVDGFHPQNLGLLAQKRPALRPCTPFGIMKLLQHYHLVRKGLHAVVVGASNIVGKPLSLEFLMAGFTVYCVSSADYKSGIR